MYVALKYAKPKAPWLTVWPIKQRAQPARWIIRMRVRHMGPSPVIHHDVVLTFVPGGRVEHVPLLEYSYHGTRVRVNTTQYGTILSVFRTVWYCRVLEYLYIRVPGCRVSGYSSKRVIYPNRDFRCHSVALSKPNFYCRQFTVTPAFILEQQNQDSEKY